MEGDTYPNANTRGNESSGQSQLKQCRICLDTTAQAVDPELGRLISPCRCKGSSRFVHEECLNLWRLQSANQANYYQCPTCKFQYKLQRLTWARLATNSAMEIGITTGILLVVVYLLGFVSEHVINMYLDPLSVFNFIPGVRIYSAGIPYTMDPTPPRERRGLVEHMLRGLTSLGFIGVAKVFAAIPTMRVGFGGNTGRPGAGGRDRLTQLSWILVAWGVINFFLLTWRWVRTKTRGMLDGVAEAVLDVQEDDEILNAAENNIQKGRAMLKRIPRNAWWAMAATIPALASWFIIRK